MINFSNIDAYNNINAKALYKFVSQKQIFEYYLGYNIKIGNVYNSPFRKDIKPSFGFYITEYGNIMSHDFSNGEKLNCIQFVSKKFNIDIPTTIKKIANDFNILKDVIEENENLKNLKSVNFNNSINLNKIHNKVKKDIKIVPKLYNNEDLKYWKKFCIEKKELEENFVFSVEYLKINNELVLKDILTFAYIEKYKNEDFCKIYQPYSEKFKWITNFPINVAFGIDYLPYKSDTLIISKSQKERIILKKFFTDVVATQNESENGLELLHSIIKEKYKKIILFWDIDNTGLKQTNNIINKYKWDYFQIPLYLKNKNIKDIAEYVEHFGIKAFEKRLKEKNIY